MAKVYVSDLAKLDLVENWNYISQDSVSSADQWIERIHEECKTLARSPRMGRKRDELSPALRSFPVGDYLIFYRPIRNGIVVVRVLSGYRDIDALFDS